MKWECRSHPGLRPADCWPKARSLVRTWALQVWHLCGTLNLGCLFWEMCRTVQCSFSLTKSQHPYNDLKGPTWPASSLPSDLTWTILPFPHSSPAPPASSNTSYKPQPHTAFARAICSAQILPRTGVHLALTPSLCLNVTLSNEAHPATHPPLSSLTLLLVHALVTF